MQRAVGKGGNEQWPSEFRPQGGFLRFFPPRTHSGRKGKGMSLTRHLEYVMGMWRGLGAQTSVVQAHSLQVPSVLSSSRLNFTLQVPGQHDHKSPPKDMIQQRFPENNCPFPAGKCIDFQVRNGQKCIWGPRDMSHSCYAICPAKVPSPATHGTPQHHLGIPGILNTARVQ